MPMGTLRTEKQQPAPPPQPAVAYRQSFACTMTMAGVRCTAQGKLIRVADEHEAVVVRFGRCTAFRQRYAADAAQRGEHSGVIVLDLLLASINSSASPSELR